MGWGTGNLNHEWTRIYANMRGRGEGDFTRSRALRGNAYGSAHDRLTSTIGEVEICIPTGDRGDEGNFRLIGVKLLTRRMLPLVMPFL